MKVPKNSWISVQYKGSGKKKTCKAISRSPQADQLDIRFQRLKNATGFLPNVYGIKVDFVLMFSEINCQRFSSMSD